MEYSIDNLGERLNGIQGGQWFDPAYLHQEEGLMYLPSMNQWLIEHGMPQITLVEYSDKNGDRLTLEQECLRSGTLPALSYGYKKCSLKHKIGPQDKFCNNYPPCRGGWARGEKVVKFIGYDAGEERRRDHDLFDRAVASENNAMPNLTSVKGLGRDWLWQEFVEANKNQIAL